MQTTDIEVKPELYIGIALGLLLLPVQWVGAWLLASGIHELFHYIAIRLCRVTVFRLQIGIGGVLMHTGSMDPWQELVCAIAGPISGFLLIFTAKYYPALAICGCVQSLYNLLPLFPMDGGRALRSVLHLLFRPPFAVKVFNVLQKIFLGILAVLTLYMSFKLVLGPMPLLFLFLLLLKNGAIKFPCNAGTKAVQ